MWTAGPACILALLLGLFFGPVPWASAELRLDARFGDGGVVRLPVSTRGDWVSGANRPVRQPDGKLLVAVGTATDRAPMQTVLLRFLRNGRLDRAFGHNGRLRLGSPWFATHDMQLQPDGRIVLLGATGYDDHALYGSPAQVGVIRLMADGSRDGSFGTNGAAVFNPPWQPDTLILKAGAGVLQAPFDGRFLIPMSVEELRRDGSANVLSSRTAFMRLDPDGSVDDSFGDGGVLNVPPEENAVGASWEALPGGDFAALLPGMTGAEVRRYGIDGRLNRGFGDDGAVKLPPGGPWSLIEAVARDGSLLASGSDSRGTARLRRILPDGRLDAGFGIACRRPRERFSLVGLAPVAGGMIGTALNWTRLTDGTRPDASFVRYDERGCLVERSPRVRSVQVGQPLVVGPRTAIAGSVYNTYEDGHYRRGLALLRARF